MMMTLGIGLLVFEAAEDDFRLSSAHDPVVYAFGALPQLTKTLMGENKTHIDGLLQSVAASVDATRDSLQQIKELELVSRKIDKIVDAMPIVLQRYPEALLVISEAFRPGSGPTDRCERPLVDIHKAALRRSGPPSRRGLRFAADHRTHERPHLHRPGRHPRHLPGGGILPKGPMLARIAV